MITFTARSSGFIPGLITLLRDLADNTGGCLYDLEEEEVKALMKVVRDLNNTLLVNDDDELDAWRNGGNDV